MGAALWKFTPFIRKRPPSPATGVRIWGAGNEPWRLSTTRRQTVIVEEVRCAGGKCPRGGGASDLHADENRGHGPFLHTVVMYLNIQHCVH